MIIKRDFYLNKLISARQNGMVKVITGIRRCGKSFLLFKLFKEWLAKNGIDEAHLIEIQFDDFAFRKYRNAEEAYNFVKSKITDSNLKNKYLTLHNRIFILCEWIVQVL